MARPYAGSINLGGNDVLGRLSGNVIAQVVQHEIRQHKLIGGNAYWTNAPTSNKHLQNHLARFTTTRMRGNGRNKCGYRNR